MSTLHNLSLDLLRNEFGIHEDACVHDIIAWVHQHFKSAQRDATLALESNGPCGHRKACYLFPFAPIDDINFCQVCAERKSIMDQWDGFKNEEDIYKLKQMVKQYPWLKRKKQKEDALAKAALKCASKKVAKRKPKRRLVKKGS